MIIFWLTCLVGYPRTSAPEPNFDISLIEYFYDYQSSLMNIAFNNFVTNSFINELKHVGISEILIGVY